MSVLLIVLAIAVIISWIIAVRSLVKATKGNNSTNLVIIAAVLTTIYLMLLFIGRG
ncbi:MULTISPECIES: hypothetical protein [unclassified Staphylococcus]|uniref:hypothetical protein n=1 Tax=unclassified Staphylococcus TaxID=91994 RepID=UPI0021D3A039|nr:MULTISPECIES: hypothetical protein [unclassified Staphylococcus]UXR69452.1 hypothetical protein MUA26_10085 [Staphylococcus sp. IVB6246]UXR71507.1 hypothetical protein MUA88_10105 [Staphylococcus sp. IVB6240]UXR73784.1 hypothetical protein MUA48_10605 [Staphylococcus sp. IVB6238]UXR76103.1 hypothetical protein MUA74_10705 [Staphylococcus sp. IVB6233]UXR80301.1 hypothetical protein MUA65_10310 [Staphylococcus sp. IVB6218]